MKISSVSVWGDSIGKCVVFDEARGRYAICKDNYASHLKAGGVTVENHSVMGYTVCQAQLAEKDMRPGGVAAIEFGGNDCDLDWKAVSENPDVYHEARTPIALFKDKLAEMVKKARAFDMRAVLVVPPPIDAEKYFAWVSKNLNPKAILRYLGDVQHIYRWQERYSNAVMRVAARTRASLADVRDCFLARADYRDCVCEDGMHLNQKGNMLMADFFIRYANRHRLELAV